MSKLIQFIKRVNKSGYRIDFSPHQDTSMVTVHIFRPSPLEEIKYAESYIVTVSYTFLEQEADRILILIHREYSDSFFF